MKNPPTDDLTTRGHVLRARGQLDQVQEEKQQKQQVREWSMTHVVKTVINLESFLKQKVDF